MIKFISPAVGGGVRSPRAIALALAATCACALPGQGRVWVVDDGPDPAEFKEIQPAIDAARDGDAILVRPGNYSSFRIQAKSLVVTGERTAEVRVRASAVFPARLVTISGLGVNQCVVLRNIDVLTVTNGVADGPVTLLDNRGTVWCEDCTFHADGRSLQMDRSDRVVLSRCDVSGGARGDTSTLHAWDTAMTGHQGRNGGSSASGGPGAPGLELADGFAFLSGCALAGGPGGGTWYPRGWGGNGGDGLLLRSGSPELFVLDSTFAGGAAGYGPAGLGRVGQPQRILSGTVTPLPGAARHFRSNPVVFEGGPVRWSFDGQNGDAALALVALDAAPQFVRSYNGTRVTGNGALVTGVLGQVGTDPFRLALTLPTFGPITQRLGFAVQGFFADTAGAGYIAPPSFLTGISLAPISRFATDCDGDNTNDIWELITNQERDDDLDGVPDRCQQHHVLHVDDDAPGDPGPGDPSLSDPLEDGSAAHPFDAIQEAIVAAPATGYTIVLVADGAYTGQGNRDIDFGGRALTVRSAGGPGQCTIDCQRLGRAFQLNRGEGFASRIDGFRIVNGEAERGGAIEVRDAGPTIVRCVFVDNRATPTSGGFSNGGAIWSYDSAIAIIDCAFDNNTCSSRGGAVCHDDSGVVRGGSLIRHRAVIRGCHFTRNVGGTGGAVWTSPLSAGVMPIDACRFEDNRADRGAGVYVDGRTTIANSTFVGNVARFDGGAVGGSVANFTIRGCTIVDNSAGQEGGGVDAGSLPAPVVITSSILWGNTAPNGPQLSLGSGAATVRWCHVEGGRAAIHRGSGRLDYHDNRAVYPQFVDRAGRDFTLRAVSICIDGGDPDDVPMLGETDESGRERMRGLRVDVGSHER